MNSAEASSVRARRRELACVIALAALFMCFTWRGLTMFFSDDDMLNMYGAWLTPVLKLCKAQVLPWMPLSRPLGNAVYRIFFGIFGFHPLPLYIFCWLLLVGNVFVAWRFFRAVASSVFVALLALSLTLVHGLFQDLYLSAGTIYDLLCFLFTVLAVTVYARARNRDELSPSCVAWLCFLCLMAMNSKESGAAVPAILFCYECIYVLPAVWREGRVVRWVRAVAPLYCLLCGILAAFIIGRVRRTGELTANPAYQMHFHFSFWLKNVAEYLSIIVYRHIRFDVNTAAFGLLAMLVLAAMLRNRAMLFGWLWFVIAVTPVALIPIRPGYVLYVPNVGMGLYFAALIGLVADRILSRNQAIQTRELSLAQMVMIGIVVGLATWIHIVHWPEPWRVSDSPEWRITEKMRRDYPTLKPGARILFVDDYPSDNGYDLLFNLRLLYHDPRLEVARLKGSADQQPDRNPREFDHVFTTALDTYVELDRRDVEESIRLNILQDYLPGRSFDYDRIDHAGYLVSGILDSGRGGIGCWTTRSAKLKFDVYPADSTLTLKFWTPDYVATGKRILSVTVDGETVGTVALTHVGENSVDFQVPSRAINPSGFTLLEMNVDNPYTKDGQEYGVLLLHAGFDYSGKR